MLKNPPPPPEAYFEKDYGPSGLYMPPKAFLSIYFTPRGDCRQERNDSVPEGHWTPIQQPQEEQNQVRGASAYVGQCEAPFCK